MAAMVEGMETLDARLASFDAAHQPKRRASNAKKPKAIKWPHQSPSPAEVSYCTQSRMGTMWTLTFVDKLAKAGFFYKPTATCPDNTTCFLCKTSLDGWEEDDDPISEHMKLSQHCGWAINMSIEQRCEVQDRVEENPLSEELMEARRSTFADRWPHEQKKGWTCKTEKARAPDFMALWQAVLIACAYRW